MAKVDLKKELDSYRAPHGEFRVVDVPPSQYLMVDGHGYRRAGAHHQVEGQVGMSRTGAELAGIGQQVVGDVRSGCPAGPLQIVGNGLPVQILGG